MRRKTDKDIIKENKWLIIGSALLILLGFLIIILPNIMPEITYDSLQTKEVTVTAFRYHHGGWHGTNYYYILTTDGEKYNLSGDFQREQAKKLLTEGRKITIKWYKNTPFRTLLAEEIYAGSECVVAYNPGSPNDDIIISLTLALPAWLLGAGGFLLLRFFLKHNRKTQKKRDERIAKKYGQHSTEVHHES